MHPDATEACNNRDDNCDGETDEGCATATPGELDPGGIHWVCGVSPGVPPGAWLLALPLILWRRRAAPVRR